MAVVVFAIITVVTIFLLTKASPTAPAKQEVVVTADTANDLKQSGIEALQNEDDEMAKELFEKAKTQYEELGDQHSVIDMEAQLHMLNN